jgi:hypothetical protein
VRYILYIIPKVVLPIKKLNIQRREVEECTTSCSIQVGEFEGRRFVFKTHQRSTNNAP